MSPSNPAFPLLRLSNLTKRFGTVTAVRDVYLEVYSGDFLTIFGPNGAGKTTLLKMVALLTRPTHGEIVFAQGLKGQREFIGYVSHQSFLYNEMSALENLVFYARLYDLARGGERIEEMLRKMGLWEVRRRLVREFSRGMKQRLTLARALLHQPGLLLLDEPYTGLDQHASRLLTRILRELKEEGRTILLITHNLNEGLELSTRVMIQHRGELVFQASRQEVKEADFQDLYFRMVEDGALAP